MKQDISTEAQHWTAPSPNAPSATAPTEGDIYSAEPIAAPSVVGGGKINVPYAHATAVEVEHEHEHEHEAIIPTVPEQRVPVACPTGASPTQPPQTPVSVATQQATANQNSSSSSSSSNNDSGKRCMTLSCCSIGTTRCKVICVICVLIVGLIVLGVAFANQYQYYDDDDWYDDDDYW